MRHAMIMAGGAGTRLWPISRREQPKQLAPFLNGRSLLEIAAHRLEGLVPAQRRHICAAEAHRAAIRAALPTFSDEQILGEPAGRDTVNAIGFTAAVLAKSDPDAIFAVLTADHLIEPVDRFRTHMDLAFRMVEETPNRLVTFSIKPTHPATGFGYVKRAQAVEIAGGDERAFHVAEFVEKPDAKTAEEYIASGVYGWNSGMFVWKAATVLEAIRLFKRESYDGLMRIAEAWGTAKQNEVLDEVYATLPKQSIDFAVMEPASRDDRFDVCTVVTDVSWRDVGSWPSFAETLEADSEGNCISCYIDAAVTTLDCTDSLIVNSEPGHAVAVLGVQGLVVVHTREATLVMPAAQAERVKDLHGLVPEWAK